MAGTAVTGIAELTQKFKTLDNNLSKKVGFKMVASGAGIIKKEAKRIALSKGLRRTGATINNIVIKREKSPPPYTIQYNVGVRHGKALGKKAVKTVTYSKRSGKAYTKRENDPYYWSFLEFGHKTVARFNGQSGGGITSFMTTLRNGQRVRRKREYKNSSITGRRRSSNGFVAAKPFIQPSLENKQQEAINQMGKVLDKELLKANQ